MDADAMHKLTHKQPSGSVPPKSVNYGGSTMTNRLSRLAAVIACFLLAAHVHAAPPISVTNYIPNTVVVPALTTNASATIFDTNKTYICFDIAQFSGLTAAQSTGDVRILADTMLTKVCTSYTALGTNVPTTFFAQGVSGSFTGSVQQVNYTVRVLYSVTGRSYPTE